MEPKRLTVLLVESSQAVGRMVQAQLSGRRNPAIRLVRAQGLEDGVVRVARGGIDVILWEVGALCEDVRSGFMSLFANAGGIPVVVMAGTGDAEEAREVLHLGAQDYIVFDRADGETMLRSLLLAVERQWLRNELRRHANELRASEERFRKIIEDNADGMLIVNREGIVEFANPAARQLLGRRRVDLVGEKFPHPVVPGERVEVEIDRGRGRGQVFAEVRATEVEYRGIPASLVSVRDITEVVRLHEELYMLSFLDELTGLYNRRGFFVQAERELKLAGRGNSRLVLLFADLDGLKEINDTLGHEAGDRALKEAATLLKQSHRASDVAARLGGDEFAVLMPRTGAEGREDPARALLAAVRRRNESRQLPFVLSLSVGIAAFDPDSPCTIDELLAQADRLMYADKERRRIARSSHN